MQHLLLQLPFILSNGVGPVLGTATNNNTTATFTPLPPLAFNNTYTAVIHHRREGCLAGNPMTSNYSWSFSTAKPPVAAGTDHTAALKSDGTLWTWGDNSKGQLGNGNTTGTDSNVPVQIGSATDWIAIAAGKDHTLAIKRNGTLWAWGRNYYIVTGGQLGLGDKLNRFAPTQVGADTNWAHVAAGSYHTVAVKTNGTLWTWGENSQASLGLMILQKGFFPTQVGTDTNWAFCCCRNYLYCCNKDRWHTLDMG